MTQDVIDQLGNPVEDDSIPFASLADLCEPLKPVTVTLETGNGLRRIKYLPYLTTDELARIQARFQARGRKGKMDTAGFMMAIVKKCMISPEIKTDRELQAFRKGVSGSFVTNLINAVVDTELFEELKDELGEA